MDTQKLTSSSSKSAGGVQLVKERSRSSNKVKLCGYLKKKRNKVGGWRKMWFVLQDKLLLSYASKEEYDNKLVSFKDVLNLVPGTMVRPLGGFRFTIETTTHLMYTFHCDDRNAYREWITMLLDSLSIAASTKVFSATSACSLLQLQQHRFRNTSVDNIPHALWSNAAQNSQRQRELSSSCDSMRQRVDFMDDKSEYAYLESMANIKTSNGMKTAAQSSLAPALLLSTHGNVDGGGGSGGGCISGVTAVRLPIARSTAKILERNGVNSSGPTKKYHQPQQYQKRQQQQVNCCNRSSGTTVNATGIKNYNNNVCSGNDKVTEAHLTTEASATHFRLHGGESTNWNEIIALDNARNMSTSGSTSSSTSASVSASSYQPFTDSILKINSMFQQSLSSSSATEGANTSRRNPVANTKFLLHSKPTPTNCDQKEFTPKYKQTNKTNNSLSDHDNTFLSDFCAMNDDAHVAENNICTAYSSCTKDSNAMVMVKDQIQRMNIKGRKETLSYTKAGAVDRLQHRRAVLRKRLEEESIIEAAASMTKEITGEASEKSFGNNDEINGKERKIGVCIAEETPFSRSTEPIYAVVDLAHKYAQRQQRNGKFYIKTLDANRCRSYESIIHGVEPSIETSIRRGSLETSRSKLHDDDDIDGIYEDGDKFAAKCENDEISNSDDDENIYEPVGFGNFSKQKIKATTAQPNSFWRYITRLKVNSLLQFTRMRRNNHVDYDTIHLPTSSPLPTPATNRKNTIALAKKQASTASPTTTTSQFASIKHKFGAHRKSMQVRVRKICARTYEPKATFNNRQSAQQQVNVDDHFVVGSTNGCVGGVGGGVGGATKKSKYPWKSVKIRPKQFNSASCSSTTTDDDISNKTTRQRFFGSLPHLRKARVSLFSTPNLNATSKDQNSNVSNEMDKTTADLRIAVNTSEYDKLNE